MTNQGSHENHLWYKFWAMFQGCSVQIALVFRLSAAAFILASNCHNDLSEWIAEGGCFFTVSLLQIYLPYLLVGNLILSVLTLSHGGLGYRLHIWKQRQLIRSPKFLLTQSISSNRWYEHVDHGYWETSRMDGTGHSSLRAVVPVAVPDGSADRRQFN